MALNRVLSGVIALGVFVVAVGGDPSIDPTHSSVIATFRQENVPVDAPFRQFSGQIDYDAAHPAAGHATISVQTGSIDLGSGDYDAEVRKPDWLDSARHPTATFVSTAIVPAAAGQFTATGTLTLKGRSVTVSVPVSTHRLGRATAFDGALQISRKAFGIGSPDWAGVIDDAVRVRFHLVE